MQNKKRKNLIFLAWGLLLLIPGFVYAQGGQVTFQGVEYALYGLFALTLVVVVAVIYNFWGVITRFGGLIGTGLNLIGSGVIILAFDIILRILDRFEWNYIKLSLANYPQLYEIFRSIIQVVGLLLVVWGLKKLASIYRSQEIKKSAES